MSIERNEKSLEFNKDVLVGTWGDESKALLFTRGLGSGDETSVALAMSYTSVGNNCEWDRCHGRVLN